MFVDQNLWETLKTGLGDLALQLAISAGAHPIVSCEILAAAALAVLYRAGTQAA